MKKRKPGAGEPEKHMGHGYCDNFTKSTSLQSFVDDKHLIAKHAKNMFKQLNVYTL